MNLWKNRKFKAILLSLIVMFLYLGCATHTRIGVDESGGIKDTLTESQDLRTVAERMARSIIQVKAISMAKSPPIIAFLSMKNNSNELIDTDMFLEKIRTLLVKYAEGRVYFLDREKVKEIIKEREAKRAGVITSSKTGELSGADYFLTGVISSIDKVRGSTRVTYTRYSFRLTDAETSVIIWEDEYEMKKKGTRAFWDR